MYEWFEWSVNAADSVVILIGLIICGKSILILNCQ